MPRNQIPSYPRYPMLDAITAIKAFSSLVGLLKGLKAALPNTEERDRRLQDHVVGALRALYFTPKGILSLLYEVVDGEELSDRRIHAHRPCGVCLPEVVNRLQMPRRIGDILKMNRKSQQGTGPEVVWMGRLAAPLAGLGLYWGAEFPVGRSYRFLLKERRLGNAALYQQLGQDALSAYRRCPERFGHHAFASDGASLEDTRCDDLSGLGAAFGFGGEKWSPCFLAGDELVRVAALS